MDDGFEIKDQQNFFDFRGFLIKLLNWWPLFLICLAAALYVAYYINVRKLTVYRMSNMITVKDDQNPFFTSNTSLTFNWGGTTDKVQTAMILLKSRSHTEKVVEELQFCTDYLKQGEYHLEDVYGSTPFKIEVNGERPQLLNKLIKLTFKDAKNFILEIPFTGGSGAMQDYDTKDITSMALPPTSFVAEYSLGDPVDQPFMNFKVAPTEILAQAGQVFYIRFKSFDGVVGAYRGINIDQTPSGSSILSLSLTGTNKKRLVDFLNTSVEVLSKDQLERKNLFATKTIKFIDSSLAVKSREMREVQDELDNFRKGNRAVTMSGGEESLVTKLTDLDGRKQNIEQQLLYYQNLESYLRNRTDYSTDIPAPSVAGIGEASIASGVATIIELSEQRNRYTFTAKPNNPVFQDLDRRVNAAKEVLLENIASSSQLLNSQLLDVRRQIGNAESQISKLPAEQQELLGIQRRYNLSESSYSVFLAKRSEAGIVKAANVSDIMVIDSARDTGGGAIGPNTRTNYVMATIVGLAVPFAFVFFLFFIDNKIKNAKDIKRLTPLTILGTIGKSKSNSNLVLVDEPHSAVAEAFRGLRSSLQFIYKRNNVEGSKTVSITSSISGEGKTFCSINLASVFALSERKTVLVGLDLRRPKIFDDFNLTNDSGVVNYLIGEKKMDEIVQKTSIENLDIILSGPVPPNPSELLIGEQMDTFMNELKSRYDYIVLDTPPIGLVADALEIDEYVDATLYVVRQDYTKKAMLEIINEKYRNGQIGNISLVLNYFRTKGKMGYGYGYDYGYSYGGYGSSIKKTWFQKLFSRFKKHNS
ncbi:MAG: sugar transporter [Cytophagaceae bacterium]|nr:sugar transporter [Cytophagaceae bacterium]|tara:strand:+ start:6885 stop:9326 length:2442 start_codon:yes stop_codon:yes gene_type:complete